MIITHKFARAAGVLLLGAGLFAAPGLSSAVAQEQASDETPQTIGQFARHYRVYRRDIDTLSEMSFTSAREVRDAYELIMSYEPSDLTRGWFAHNAIVASRAPGFMETVRIEADDLGFDRFFSNVRQNPTYLWELSSTTSAIDFVFDGVYQDTREAHAVGRVLNDRAHAYMDRRYGSRLPASAVENATAILAAETNLASSAIGGRNYVVPYRARNVMAQVLELAARLSLDSSGGRNISAAGLLIDHQDTNQCLRWARLNLAQCIAAARTTAEEAYCTGRHGVEDVSDCWGWMVDTDGGAAEQAALGH